MLKQTQLQKLNSKAPSIILEHWISIGYEDLPYSSRGYKETVLREVCSVLGLTRFFKKHYEEYSHLRMDILAFVISNKGSFNCVSCGAETLEHNRLISTSTRFNPLVCSKHCGNVYKNFLDPNRLKEKERKRRLTNNAKYGCDIATQNTDVKLKLSVSIRKVHELHGDEIEEKKRNTCMETYGVDHPFKDPGVRESRRVTCQDKYGVDNPLFLESSSIARKAALEISHADPKKRRNQREKTQATCMERYGHTSYLGSAAGAGTIIKSAAARGRLKEFTEYSIDWKLQGSEPAALYYMVEELEFKPKSILYGIDVPRFTYTKQGSKHTYFPDFFYKKGNLIVEVKSPYTAYGISKKSWGVLKAKAKAVLDSGHRYLLILVKGSRINHLYWDAATNLRGVKNLV